MKKRSLRKKNVRLNVKERTNLYLCREIEKAVKNKLIKLYIESSKQSVTEFPFETLTEEQKEMLIQSALAPWHLDEQQRLHWIQRRLEELENPPKECMSLAYYVSHEFFLENYEQLLRDFQKEKEGTRPTTMKEMEP